MWATKVASFAAVMIGFLSLGVVYVNADILTVGASGDHSTIAAAVSAASSGDVVMITYVVHTENGILINKDITIKGQGADQTIVQAAATRGTAGDSIFTIAGGTTVTFEDMTFKHGDASSGGAINMAAWSDVGFTVKRCAFVDNDSVLKGGAIFFSQHSDSTQSVSIVDSVFSGNKTADGVGAAVYLDSVRYLHIRNSTFSSNTANHATPWVHGGAVFIQPGVGEVGLVQNCTFFGNVMNETGDQNRNHGAALFASAQVTTESCVFAENVNGDSTFMSGGNLSNSVYETALYGVTDLGGNTNVADAKLGSLMDNGGPTMTHALLAGSPAINEGSNPAGLLYDQRGAGYDRSVGVTDCGAYEYNSAGGENVAPVINSIVPVDITPEIEEGASIDFSVIASDADSDPLSYEWRVDNVVKSTTSNYMYVTTSSDVGTRTVKATVMDDGGLSDEQTWFVTVTAIGGSFIVRTVGPGYSYSTINAAYAAADPGDTILVYPQAGDVPYSQPALQIYKDNISFIGQAPNGERVKLDGFGYNYTGAGSTPRAVFQFNAGADGGLVENFEISNCTNSDFNAAAVRISYAHNITVRNCDVHDCDNGFMSNGGASNQLIENCLVYNNGNIGHYGYNHNFYVAGDSLTIRNCNIYSPTTGHNIKSRAHLSIIEGCYIHDSRNRELDLVDGDGDTTTPGSHALIKGCTIVKSPSPENKGFINFGQDGGNNHDGTLYIINSTLVTPFTAPVVTISAPDAGVCFQNTLVVDPTGNTANQVLVAISGGASMTNSSGASLWLSYGLNTPAGGSFTNTTIAARYYVPPFSDTPNGDYHLDSSVTDIVDAGQTIDDRNLPTPFRLRPALEPETLTQNAQPRFFQNAPDLGSFEWIVTAQTDANAPSSPVKLVFVHQSCGDNWLDTGNGNLGNVLGQNNYYVRDTYSGWDATLNLDIGSSTDIGHWYNWFANTIIQSNGTEQRGNIMRSLYMTSNKNATYDSATLADPGGENDLVIFMSCYLNNKINDNNSTTPQELYGQPYASSAHTLDNCKAVYNQILNYMKNRDDKMFVIVTAPPLLSSDSTLAQAANARTFNNWLVNDWLRDDNWVDRNVFVFDLYNTLTATNNHHRVNGGIIEHIATNGDNYAGPYCTVGDNLPTVAGNQKATAEFVPLLNVYYNRWMTRRDAVDNDGDGMSDRWEMLYAGDTSMYPEEDDDGDTLSNIEELIAGSDPTNNMSKLVADIAYSNGAPRINFLAQKAVGAGYAGRTRSFSIQQTYDLFPATWSDIPGYTNITGVGQDVIYTPPANQSRYFYRLRTNLE